ncbi:MAG TPA: DUF4157 domain-containing protein [Kofleriaceae bacterium]|nr:DUF4157 domain-containing protein [Kofleriaceae bacterium]
MTLDLDQRPTSTSADFDDSVAPGRGTLTSRLAPSPRQTIVFRVESAEAANALADRFGARDGNGVASGADVAVQRAASSSSGAALPGDVKDRFESSLGADLSGVRVHTGSESAEAASAVGAHAYTVGQDIHFGAGKFAPADPFGLHLLAHEVAHTVQQSGGAQRMQAKLEVSTPGDSAEVEADRAADAMVAGQLATISGSSGVARRIDRYDDEESQTCRPDGPGEEGAEGGEKKEGEDPDIAAKVKPLKIAGLDLGLKVTKDGFSANLSKSLAFELPPVPVCPGVSIVFEPKVTASIGVKWTKAAGWAGEVGLGGAIGVFLRGGTPFAYVQGGAEVSLPLKATIDDNGIGPLKGDLTAALKVEAALKVPWSGKGGKVPNLNKPEGWANSGGVSFEYEVASAKLVHIEITTDGVTATWIGPDIGPKMSALEQAKADYDRNFGGGGAEGGPPSSPYEQPAEDDGGGGAGGAANDRPAQNDGGGGAGGAHG